MSRIHLTFPQLRALATWLETKAEATELDYLPQTKIAELAQKDLGFEIRSSSIRTLRDQLGLTWKDARGASKQTHLIQIEAADLLCITTTLCTVIEKIPSLRLDPNHCMEKLHTKLTEQMQAISSDSEEPNEETTEETTDE